MNVDEPLFYHVWFGTKRRKWLLLGEIEETAKKLIFEICAEKCIDLVACETMPEHVHLLLKCRPGGRSAAVHMIKGATSRRIFQAFPELKMDAETESFWQARYGFKIVPAGALESTAKYIATQKDRLEKFERS